MALRVSIIDYEMGNLFSVKRACENVGLDPVITSDKRVLMDADALILPGVGAFGDAMTNLRSLDLVSPIRDFVDQGKPFMGICLGMQLLMSESEEFGNFKGLDIITGSVVKFAPIDKDNNSVKVPQVGWNRIHPLLQGKERKWGSSPLQDIDDGEYMYFVHSYYTVPEDPEVVLACTIYEGTEYASSLFKKNIFACQFHPEKSAAEGLKIYKNWSLMIRPVHEEGKR